MPPRLRMQDTGTGLQSTSRGLHDNIVGLQDMILAAWSTNNRVTIFLIEHVSAELWDARLPGMPHRTIRMLASHLHNARCMWLKTLGRENGIDVPRSVDRYKASTGDLLPALEQSGAGILSLLRLGLEQGGHIPPTSAYVWRNLPLDVGHVLGYFIAHEGHHRGQIVMLARQLGHRLPVEVTGGLWQWSRRAREVQPKRVTRPGLSGPGGETPKALERERLGGGLARDRNRQSGKTSGMMLQRTP